MVKVILTCVLFLLLSLLSINPISAESILFQDNFDDGNVSDWVVTRNDCLPATWNIRNVGTLETPSFQYGIVINDNCITDTIPTALTIPVEISYRFEVDMIVTDNSSDRNFVFKYVDPNNWYDIHIYGQMIHIQKVIGGVDLSNTLLNSFGSYTFQVGQTYHFSVDVFPTMINLYINDELLLSVTDPGPYLQNQSAGLQASGGGDPTSEVWFDNVIVTQLDAATPTPTPTATPTATAAPTPTATTAPTATPTPSPNLPSLNVPNIKQFTPPWGYQIYDTATLWSTNPFISSWGCALTSAAMVLRFYGHDVWPDTLNNWLKSQVDGYLRNGLLNWLAVSRYTRIYDSEASPTLEYRRIPPTAENLTGLLEDEKPGILGEPGHFIVAKSILPGSFGINDPAYNNRSTLGSYGNSLSSLGVYIPTHTDLSYIYLVIDADLDIRVFYSENNEIEGFTTIEDPIIDPGNPSTDSGESLKTFMFPAPPDGIYHVVISGNGLYVLDSYVYDEEGNVVSDSFEGILIDAQYEQLNLNMGESPEISQEITIESIIADLDEAYGLGLIRSRRVYLGIRSQLLSVRRYSLRGRIRQVRTLLSLTRMTIGLYTPLAISPEVSSILRGNVQTLITSL